jgi:glutathione S-transferase
MPGPYRLYGAELSPYSIKVRNYLRFKGIEHSWIARSAARQAEFARFARLPLIPVLVGSDDFAMQDSTPIIDKLEGQNPEPSIKPEDDAGAYLSALLEDYADEWVNKAMFHYRWTYPADQDSAAARLVAMIYDGAEAPEGAADAIKTRMVGRLHHVGSTPETGGLIEGSFRRLIGYLEAHLARRAYLFGARPALADFGLGAQLGQLLSDPTPGAILRAEAPHTVAWLGKLDVASVEGPFEPLSDLWPTLKPIFAEEVGGLYLPWSLANHAAAKTETEFTVTLPGGDFTQNAQKYAARALTDLRRKRVALAGHEGLAALLTEVGCEAALNVPAPNAAAQADAGPQEGGAPAADSVEAESETPA